MTNSKDLPVTEWWDPEWDVYDVPLSPFEGDTDVDTWWAAYEHQWVLGWIMTGEAVYIPAPFAHQVTTGHDATCPARYSDESECAGAGDGFCTDVIDCTCKLIDSGTQFAHWTDPYCRMHGEPLRSRPVATYGKPPACTCRYGLHPTIWSPTHRVDVPGVGMRGAAYTFRIDGRCPHHGEARYVGVMVGSEPHVPAWVVLDDAERRGD